MPVRRERPRPLLPLGIAAFVSVIAGLLLTLAFPGLSWWPMVFVAVPLALITLIGRSVWGSLLVGFLFGAAFFLVNVLFTARYLGPVPWLALSFLEAAMTGIASIAITLAYRWTPRVLKSRSSRLTLLPALVAALWTMREQWLGSWPYGGFPWGRIGVTQAGGPLAHLASWVGMSGLSFLIVLVCAAAIEYFRAKRFRYVKTAIPTLAVVAILILMPQFPTTPAGSLRVGAVQGNGPAGYFDKRSPDAVLNAQLAATAPLFGEKIDVLLWPEGGVDSDPTRNGATAATLDALASRIGAPMIVSAVTQRGSQYFNSSLLWKTGADNPVQTYDKRHPVPFGEYVPDRWFYNALAPDLIGLIQRGYTPGTKPPVFDVDGVGVGLAICFDVIYDDVIWDGADDGAQVYMFQTNNADFRGTDENLQQLAFAQMRAMETGRSVVNISTVGTSQIIAPDGSEIAGLKADTAGHLLADVPLRTGLTPAVIAGPWIKGVLGWGSLLALVACGVVVTVRGRRAKKTPTP
ncbi:MAG: apolipoprotein N-acyltransferase [Microbacterium sp.]|uniref:apolipoprotein N-acyltransferase n=1 Tax=Microbacterium sp. TaxID=51671 RepID=UPI001AC909AF|nr:apolipoprotein N-acyltransferase [Microbacterium sp.]MBN9152620.1 apolipoprotein N-acyltransferase [Microbacterium sp.]MBN9171461.1 apolipoprotein N-acyltransferase [Microbacterium sp.]